MKFIRENFNFNIENDEEKICISFNDFYKLILYNDNFAYFNDMEFLDILDLLKIKIKSRNIIKRDKYFIIELIEFSSNSKFYKENKNLIEKIRLKDV